MYTYHLKEQIVHTASWNRNIEGIKMKESVTSTPGRAKLVLIPFREDQKKKAYGYDPSPEKKISSSLVHSQHLQQS
jgi:hypothetical protein